MKKTSLPKTPLRVSIISNWTVLGVNFIIAFILTPYLISKLGKANYGIWMLSGSVIGYYGLLRLSVGTGVIRYVPYYLGRADLRSVSETISTSMAIFLVVGLVILMISLTYAEKIAYFFKAGDELAFLIRILGIAAAIASPAIILDACIRARERWLAANSVEIAKAVFRATGLWGSLYFGKGLVGMGYVVLVVTIFSMILLFILFVKYYGIRTLKFTFIKINRAKILVSFGILVTISGLVYTLRLAGHTLIIGKILSLKAVGIYSVAVILIRNVRKIAIVPTRVFWPRFAYLHSKDKLIGIRTLFLDTTKFCAILTSGIMLLLITLGPGFIHLWVGRGFEEIYPVLIILAIGYLIELSMGNAESFLCSTGRQKVQAVIALAVGFFGFGLSIIFAKHMGMLGVALGFLTANVIIIGIILPVYICKLLKIKVYLYYPKYFLRPWMLIGVLTFIAYNMQIEKYLHSWLSLVIAGLVLTSLYAICSYCFVLDAKGKKAVKKSIKNIFGILKIA